MHWSNYPSPFAVRSAWSLIFLWLSPPMDLWLSPTINCLKLCETVIKEVERELIICQTRDPSHPFVATTAMKLHSIATIATIAAFAVNSSGKVPVILCLMLVFVVVEPQISSNVAPLALLTLFVAVSLLIPSVLMLPSRASYLHSSQYGLPQNHQCRLCLGHHHHCWLCHECGYSWQGLVW